MERARLFANNHLKLENYDSYGSQTLLEKIKTLYNDTPGLSADKIGPTVGQNSRSI